MNSSNQRRVGFLVGALAVFLLVVAQDVAIGDHVPGAPPADVALKGVPLAMTPHQQPPQFSMQLRDDVKFSRGVGILRRQGKDVEYTFSWMGLTSPVTSAHFHKAPHGTASKVGARGYSICGVPGESPACPKGTTARISGVWKNADIEAFEKGEITVAFHTEVYPAPIGELGLYLAQVSPKR